MIATVGTSAQRAMEHVRVGVGEPGQHQAGQQLVIRRADQRRLDSDDEAAFARKVDRSGDPVADEGGRAPVGAHAANSASTSANASTPARQSAVSACSPGACETPVGLRTNSMVLGT